MCVCMYIYIYIYECVCVCVCVCVCAHMIICQQLEAAAYISTAHCGVDKMCRLCFLAESRDDTNPQPDKGKDPANNSDDIHRLH